MIVEGTMDGLAAARSRGRVGGRPPVLTRRQLDQAQRMYDSGEHTVAEIAETFRVGRTTLYRQLHAHKDAGDCALVVYRNTRTRKIDADTSRRYGEIGASEKVQLEADRKWFPIAPARWPRLKPIVYVVDGAVAPWDGYGTPCTRSSRSDDRCLWRRRCHPRSPSAGIRSSRTAGTEDRVLTAGTALQCGHVFPSHEQRRRTGCRSRTCSRG
ncbi:helix-turn-helix domain-containing protein [Amycolatopsis sp. NPDC051373]|uniref:helix-turn-helix domain-containing protein n=1 Tax=Amycolatopsis sp. NPDC051373 TaxID=3155801 RepID=UPI00344D8401